jgi:hypothetical protein
MRAGKYLFGLWILAALGSSLMSGSVSAKEYFTVKNNVLERPTGYREWVYVGTPLTPNDMNNGKANFQEFHTVYIDPESWEHWKKTGNVRDGAILIKEMTSVGSKVATSGKGYFMGDFIGLEATIKSKREFPDEPGNWGYFSFTNEDHKSIKKAAKLEPTANCNGCHQTSAKDDFVFTQYYPVLRAGKSNPEKAIGGK